MIAQSNTTFNPRAGAARGQSTPVFCNGRPVGQVSDGVFRKTVRSSRHFLRQPRAICFDRSTLHDAEAAGATLVQVYDADDKDTYAAEIATVWAHCFPVLRGHGDQVGLALDWWSINGAQPLAERRAAETNRERCELQLGLFAGVQHEQTSPLRTRP
jgi:hypothetical protein